jgi:hypothetical protein
MHPLATYSLIQQTYADYSAAYRLTWSALTDTLPLNVHLLTLDQLGPKNYLIRVEHYFELNEDDTYSQAVTFDLQFIFQSIGTINNAIELTLAANLPLSELQRLNWTTNDEQSKQMKIHSNFFNLIDKYFSNKLFCPFFRQYSIKSNNRYVESNANSNVQCNNCIKLSN